MDVPSIPSMLEAERRGLVETFRQLTDDQWQAQSLCQGWTVKDVAAHIVAGAETNPASFFAGLIGSGFKFNEWTKKEAAKRASATPDELIARLESKVSAKNHPPGPRAAMLDEALVHGEDIRRPLGISYDYPAEHLIATLSFAAKAGAPIGAKARVKGLALRASDVEWSTGTDGSGAEVVGPATSLLLVMTGRPAALEDLQGDGVKTLATRLPAGPE